MVQAPHSAMPQPNLVPVISSTSRSTQSTGIAEGASTSRTSPFTFSLIAMRGVLLHRRVAPELPAELVPLLHALVVLAHGLNDPLPHIRGVQPSAHTAQQALEVREVLAAKEHQLEEGQCLCGQEPGRGRARVDP